MSRRHVLVLNHFARPRDASGGTRHVDLFSQLKGWDATILASDRNYLSQVREPRTDGLLRTVWTLPAANEGVRRVVHWLSYVVPAVFTGLRGSRPSLVYASTPHLFSPVAGWLLARRYHVPLIVEVRDLWPQVLVDMGRLRSGSLLHRLLKGVEEWGYRRAAAVVVMAEGVRHELATRGVSQEHIWFVPNGAEPDDFFPSAPRETLRRRYGMEGLVFVYTGAHGPANGLDLLLDAFLEIRDEVPEARLVLVGAGTEKARLQKRASAELGDTVQFLDPIPKAEIPDLLAAADCGVHVLADVPLFRYGVSPNKVVDYMAAGRPVITNTAGEVSALVETAGAGEAVAPGELAHGIRKVAKATSEQRRQWGEAGRAYVAAHRSPRVLVEQLEKLLDTAVGERP